MRQQAQHDAGAPSTPPAHSPPPRRTRWAVLLAVAVTLVALLLREPGPASQRAGASIPESLNTAYRVFFMRFFRDVSRAKAHRRLHHTQHALMTLLMGREAPLTLQQPDHTTPQFTVRARALPPGLGFKRGYVLEEASFTDHECSSPHCSHPPPQLSLKRRGVCTRFSSGDAC